MQYEQMFLLASTRGLRIATTGLGRCPRMSPLAFCTLRLALKLLCSSIGPVVFYKCATRIFLEPKLSSAHLQLKACSSLSLHGVRVRVRVRFHRDGKTVISILRLSNLKRAVNEMKQVGEATKLTNRSGDTIAPE